jgi:hypothetical protein
MLVVMVAVVVVVVMVLVMVIVVGDCSGDSGIPLSVLVVFKRSWW